MNVKELVIRTLQEVVNGEPCTLTTEQIKILKELIEEDLIQVQRQFPIVPES